tara:strand:- start:2508 stop:3245 length:738 start_codon:yes stop_codon:yes gene_type:complete
MLRVKEVSKAFGGIRAINNAKFDVKEGKITGLIGPNGAGKTTLFDVITGLIRPDNGSIVFVGDELYSKTTHKIINKGISRTFQQVRLFRNLTIREHLYMAMDHRDMSLIRNLFSFSKMDEGKEKKAKNALKLIGLDKPLNTLGGDLSYGQSKLLDLAMALVKPHKLLMLDEPVAGVNPKLRKQIKEILLRLKKEGATILIIEHDMNFIMDICDHIVVLDAGKELVEGPPKDIQNNPKVLEAYLGE